MKIQKVEIKKMHHRDGPDTEVAAAHKVARKVAGRRLEALKVLAKMKFASGSEIAETAGLSVLMVRPRLTELQEMGLIEDTQARKNNHWGSPEIVWSITQEGKKYVH